MTMLLERRPTAEVADASARRRMGGLLWDQAEVSRFRQLAAWTALAVTIVVAILLLLGG